MTDDRGTLLSEFTAGNLRALSQLISAAENQSDSVCSVLSSVFSSVGRASVVGITGPPGAGKSTLTNHFVRYYREQSRRVAMIAVDPVSPFTGGALLGDRIRLQEHFNDPGVFIRSLSTRGKLGGLSLATREVVHLVDAFGFDSVVVETVGVGQSEVDIRKIADVTVVVLVPEWGDAVQTLKAGLLEIGDLFVVNKSDREGADRLVTELKNMLQMAHKEDVPVLSSSTLDDKTVRAVHAAIGQFLVGQGEKIARRRKQNVAETAAALLEARLAASARQWAIQHATKTDNPYAFYEAFLKNNPVDKWQPG